MKTLYEHIADAAIAALNAIEFCGSPEHALAEYCDDHGISRMNPDRSRIMDEARSMAQDTWDERRAEARAACKR